MDEYIIFKYIEFLMISLYMIFAFLSVQIYFIWIDVDTNELRSKISANDSILKNSVLTVFFIGTFLIIQEFVIGLKSSYLFEIFELLSFICVLCFIYKWHLTLKTCAHKRKSSSDFLLDACMGSINKIEPSAQIVGIQKKTNFGFISMIFVMGVMLAFSVPLSTIYFALIIGLVFVPPILAFASTILGGFLISRELCMNPYYK